MKPRLPGIPAIAAFMLSAMLAMWLGLFGQLNPSDIKDWQTSIGFAVAMFVGWIGWINVSRQLDQQRKMAKLTIYSREEDRIERALPGLKEARFLFGILHKNCANAGTDVDAVRDTLRRYGLTSIAQAAGAEEASKALPQSDSETVQQLRRIVRRVLAASELLHRARRDNEADEEVKAIEFLNGAVGELATQLASATEKIIRYERRLPLIRAEIDRYFEP